MLERQNEETPPGATDASKMAYGYNEVILDVWPMQDWEALLPHAIIAFFAQPLASAEEKRRALSARERYVASRQLLFSQIPLVLYDPRAARAPFSLWDGQGLSPPPPPRPPPPQPSATEVIKQLHSRFHRSPDTAAWDASGALADAAVLVHVFDGWEQKNGQSWAAQGSISCSLIYGSLRPRGHYSIPTYSAWASGVQGVIFRPGPTTRILCGNAADSSVGKCKEHWCPSVSLSQDSYDPTKTRGNDGPAGCYVSWKPQDFGVFLRRFTKYNKAVKAAFSHRLDYNEIIVDGGHWTDHLPDSIEAFFTSDELGMKEEQEGLAIEQHRLFLQTYHLSAAQVPLLKLDPTNWDEPFRVLG